MLDVWPYLGLGCALIVICFVAGMRRLAALDEAQFAIDGSCVQVTSQGQTQKYCAADAVTHVEQAIAKTLTADQRTAFEHLFSGLANVGIDTTQSGGKWYVNPVRFLRPLQCARLRPARQRLADAARADPAVAASAARNGRDSPARPGWSRRYRCCLAAATQRLSLSTVGMLQFPASIPAVRCRRWHRPRADAYGPVDRLRLVWIALVVLTVDALRSQRRAIQLERAAG